MLFIETIFHLSSIVLQVLDYVRPTLVELVYDLLILVLEISELLLVLFDNDKIPK